MSIFKKKDRKTDAEQRLRQQRANILSAKSDFYTREAYKILRTNISFAVPKEGCRIICVTSAMASEGKSITCLNLALSFAELGARVLLVDADMRKPTQGRLLKKKSAPGLSNLLAGLVAAADVIHTNARDGLDVIMSGDIPPNPSELLGSERMKLLMTELQRHYDYIFIDTPPINVVTDASVAAQWTDGVLFVVRQGQSETTSVQHAVGRLTFANAKILGFVFNGTKLELIQKGYGKYRKYKKYSGYNYGYYYGYRYGYSYGHTPRHGEGKDDSQ